MLAYKELLLQNWVLFDQARLRFDMHAPIVIGGENHTQKAIRSNGAGKSLLLSAIPTLWYGSGPAILSMKSRARRDAFYRSQSRIEVHFTLDHDQYTIRKYLSGRALRYDVEKNGESLEFTNATSTEEWIASFVPTEEQFYTTTYLDSRRPVLTMLGQGSQRFQFFSDVFRLDSFDNIRAVLEQGKHSIQAEKAVLESQKTELSECRKTISEMKAALKDYPDKVVVEMQNTLRELQERHALHQVLSRECQKLQSKECHRATYDADAYQSAKQTVSRLETATTLFHEYATWRKTSRKVQREIAVLQDKISSIPEPRNGEHWQLEKQIADAKKMQDTLKKLSQEIKARRQEIEKMQAALDRKKLQSLGEKVRKARADLALAKVIHGALKLIKKSGNLQCPICGSGDCMSPEMLKKRLKHQARTCKQLEAQLDDDQSQLTHLKLDAELLEDVEKTQHVLLHQEREMIAQSLSKKEIRKMERRFDALKTRAQLSNEIEALHAKIPAKPKSAPETDPSRQLDSARESLVQMKQGRKWAKFLEQCDEHGISVQDIQKTDNEADPRIAELAKTLSDVERDRALLKDAKARANKLQSQVEQAKIHVERAQAMDALLGAYGSAGLKRHACVTLAEKLQENINAIAPLLFDHYTFHFDVTAKDFRILFEDPARTKTFDVRNLSGSESRAFTLLSTMALLPLLPNRYRSNMLVLDEFEVNMDDILRDRFVNQVLPVLQTLVPCVIIITPFPEYYPEGTHGTVVKKGAKSQLTWR